MDENKYILKISSIIKKKGAVQNRQQPDALIPDRP